MTKQTTPPQEDIAYRGKLFKIVHTTQPDGRVFESARRAPGVRLIVPDRQQRRVLLTKEFRHELQAWDYRLPGGKVFDSLPEYDAFRASGQDIAEAAAAKARAEGREEAGLDIGAVQLFKKSTLGATVAWDLYVFEATQWQLHSDGQQLEAGERIEADTWVEYEAAERMILEGHMQEERIALILLQWLHRI